MSETPTTRIELGTGWVGGEFVSAIACGAEADVLFQWLRKRLLSTGWLRLDAPDAPCLDLMEPGAGKVTVPLVGERTRAQDAAISHIGIAATRAALRALMMIRDKRSGGVFLHNAVVGGLVQPVTTASGFDWVPRLREGQQLSNWLLAVFAADMLRDGRDPAGHLSICDRCGRVTMEDGCFDLCETHRGDTDFRPMLDFVRGGALLPIAREPPRGL